MKPKFIVLLTFLLSLISCHRNETETVKIDGKYTIEISSLLSRANNLYDGASLQYSNERRELYIVILEERKKAYSDLIELDPQNYEPGIKGYADLLITDTQTRVKADIAPLLTESKINKQKACTTEFTGKVDGIPIYWQIAYIEGKNTYYQIMTWTLNEKKEEYQDTMKAMINSFKETDKSKRH